MQKLLADVHESASLIDVGERKFHELRKQPGFPAPVALGQRCLRWRVAELQA
jgi:predicted DNA-binding transcriptional regulator AlpA